MLIATFNVNSVRARLHILAKWLRDCRPDILFIQETKCQDHDFPEQAFTELGYDAYYHGEKSYNGVAALVKTGLNDDVRVEFGFNLNFNDNDGESGNFDTRVLTLRYKKLVVLNTYVPQGKEITSPDYEIKKAFFARVRKLIERETQEKNSMFVWLGDLNVAPTELDVTNPDKKKDHVCFTREIRDVFAHTREGLVDLLRLFDKGPEVFTFYDYRVKDAVNKKIGWRIDHMLASESLAKLAVSCKPDIRPRLCEKPSDHVPLIAELAI